MKVALVVPESNLKLNDACVPMNLACLATYVQKHLPQVEISIIDGVVSRNVEQQIFMFQPDIVGLTFTTPQAPFAYKLADTLKRVRPNLFVVMGGVHASALPNEAKQHCNCVVVGEGELAFLKIILQRMVNAEIPEVIHGEYLKDLDEVPLPSYNLINVKEYLKHGPPFPGLKPPIMSLVTSRGCPHRCPFCRNSGRREPVRYFSAQRVAAEIIYCHIHYGVTDFFFNDDEFLINKKRLKLLSEFFREYGISKWIRWGCQARVNTIDAETLTLAKSMGCVVVSPGFESGTQRILDVLKCKTTTLDANEKALRVAEKVGVTMGGSFIFGTPTETLEEMKTSFRWFESHRDLKFIGINTLIPYPGTTVWSYARKYRLLPEKVDYTRLVPTSTPETTYIINRAVDAKVFNRFVVDIQRVAWVLTQLRLGRSFWGLAKFKTWWWMWLRHPKKTLKILVYETKWRKQK